MNDIVLGYGWYDLENELFRWTNSAFSLFILNKNVKKLSIEFDCNKVDNNYCGFYLTNNWNKINYEPGTNIVDIDVSNCCELKFKSSFFIPSNIDTNSTDNRTLGIQVHTFKIWYENGLCSEVPIKEVSFKKNFLTSNQFFLNKSIQHISFGAGWHELEDSDIIGPFRWTNGNCEFCIDLKIYDIIKVKISSPINQKLKIIIDNINTTFMDVVSGESEITITDLLNAKKINIISEVFIPNEIDSKSFDTRKLGLQVYGVQLIGEDDINIKNINIKNIFRYIDLPALIDFSNKYEFRDKNYSEINSNGHIIIHNLPNNSNGKINLDDQLVFYSHRSGWSYVIDCLKQFHHKRGVKFEGFLERNFSWNKIQNIKQNKIPFTQNWIGVIHNPMTSPLNKKDIFCTERLLNSVIFKKSLETCKGLFVLSNDLKQKLQNYNLNVPIEALYHPTVFPEKIFDYQSFLKNKKKKVIQIGSWMRKYIYFNILNLNKDIWTKYRIIPPVINYEKMKDFIDSEISTGEYNKYVINYDIKETGYVSDEMYDDLLSKNIVFVNYYDVSASNLIVECIARATPVLVNKHPAVVEYLGEDYPFYFDTKEEAESKLEDVNNIEKVHNYLLTLNTRQLISIEYFENSFKNSNIYQSIPPVE